MAENKDYPEQTNMYYTEAFKFILTHEFVHISEEHIDKKEDGISKEEELEMEIEADEKAIEYMISEMEEGREFIYECGIIIGLISLFFLNKDTKREFHPNLEDRLMDAFNKLDLHEAHYAWGMACVGIKLWENQFQLNFNWGGNVDTYKDLFYSLYDQIKKQHK